MRPRPSTNVWQRGNAVRRVRPPREPGRHGGPLRDPRPLGRLLNLVTINITAWGGNDSPRRRGGLPPRRRRTTSRAPEGRDGVVVGTRARRGVPGTRRRRGARRPRRRRLPAKPPPRPISRHHISARGRTLLPRLDRRGPRPRHGIAVVNAAGSNGACFETSAPSARRRSLRRLSRRIGFVDHRSGDTSLSPASILRHVPSMVKLLRRQADPSPAETYAGSAKKYASLVAVIDSVASPVP